MIAGNDLARLLGFYADARFVVPRLSRAALERRQARGVARLVSETLARVPFYRDLAGRPLEDFPPMTKALMMERFDEITTAGITRAAAFELAERAEATRDFSPMIGDVSVGLSTGTSGRRGLFLVSRRERMAWAGVMLGRMLPGGLLTRHRIAFFLRANNRLYESVSGRARIAFSFFDLIEPLEKHWQTLAAFGPTILIAPAQVLRGLAKLQATKAQLMPERIISVAEVLFDDDRAAIEAAFGRRVDQVYQCTEGFLGYTCREGRLHLNEGYVQIEPEWVDRASGRFLPIVTDLERVTQPIVRYRLDDILTLDGRPCPCGSAERAIAAIEGRADDVLILPGAGGAVRVYPDFVARAILGVCAGVEF